MAKSAETGAHRYHQNANEVLGNSLIVGHICSFMSSEADLRNLRLVNNLFQEEAAKQFRKVYKHIFIEEESRVEQLLSLTNNRGTLQPFPFSAFEVNIKLRQEILESFGAAIGPHITRYIFNTGYCWLRDKTPLEIRGRVAMLLSHSKRLTDLHFDTVNLYVSEDDRSRIPATFPHLKRFGIFNENTNNSVPPGNVFPLIDLVVSRAQHINSFKIPLGLSTVRSRVLRFMAEDRPNNLPYFLFGGCCTVTVHSIPFLQELMDLKLKFREISIRIVSKNELEAQSIVQTVGYWLEMQRNCLTALSVFLRLPPTTTFRFPVLPVLKKLFIKFHDVPGLPSPPVLPFNTNQFPPLQKLRDRYRNIYGIFGSCSMPGVKELDLRNHWSPLTNSFFHVTFPNLTSFRLDVNRKHPLEFSTAVVYTLTHLTSLVHLDLGISIFGEFASDTGTWETDLTTGTFSLDELP